MEARRRPVTESSPRTSETVEFHAKEIFGLSKARWAMTFEARNWSRLWTTTTSEAKFVRKRASSIAESPPPTTASLLSLKKKPSQVAQ